MAVPVFYTRFIPSRRPKMSKLLPAFATSLGAVYNADCMDLLATIQAQTGRYGSNEERIRGTTVPTVELRTIRRRLKLTFHDACYPGSHRSLR